MFDCIVLVVGDRGGWGRSGNVDRTDIRDRHDKAACRKIQSNELLYIASKAFYRFRKGAGVAVVQLRRCVIIHTTSCLEALRAAGW